MKIPPPNIEDKCLYFGLGARVYGSSRIVDLGHLFLDDFAAIDDFTFLMATGGIHIGKYVHFCPYSMVSGGGSLTVGDFSEISYGAKIITGTDDIFGPYLFTPSVPPNFRKVHRLPVDIGALCFIGANAIVYPGVKIGQGVVVEPGTIVKTSLAAWHVYEGASCKCVGIRKGKDEILNKMKEALADSVLQRSKIKTHS